MFATESAALAAGPAADSVGLYFLPQSSPAARYQWLSAVDLVEDDLAVVEFELIVEL